MSTEVTARRSGITGPNGEALTWGDPRHPWHTHYCEAGDHRWGCAVRDCVRHEATPCVAHGGRA